jgi:dipeptidyl aminopeptidase/acylaminoacyl peptidase/formylglycine-generating enzyme required for sulfatase activity
VIFVSSKRFWLLPFVLAIAFIGAIALFAADEQNPPSTTSPWKPEDVVYAERSGGFRISPNSRWVAWVKGEACKEKDKMISNLFLSSLTEDREIQLNRGTDDILDLSWSPDSEWIAFISDRPRPQAKPDADPTQIWLISARGGEAYPLTELSRGPRGVQWLNADTLIFGAPEDPSAYEQALKKKKDDSEVVDDSGHQPPVRLFKISIKDKKITRLTNNLDWIQNWYVSKDGKYVVANHQKSLHYTFDQKVPPVSILHNLTDGSEKQIFTEGRIRPFGFEWLPDSSGFYAWAPYSTDARFLTASIILLYYYDLSTGKSVQVPLDWENGIGSDLAATQDGFILGLAAGHRFETSRYVREGSASSWSWKRIVLDGERSKNIQNFEVSADGKTIVYRSSTASTMPQLFRAAMQDNKLGGTFQLTHLNSNLVKSRAFSKSEVIDWKGSNGEEVEGILRYPTDYEAGKKYPLVTAIHGGPAGADLDAWSDRWGYPYQLLTQRGAFVLSPNYHGSSNYGLKWLESICCGNYYDLETPDINSGVDYLIEKGLVDPDKVATMGWSNGSILSTSLITTYPSRYKVASVGAGDVEWISDWGNVVFGDSFDSYYFGKNPMEDPQLYIRKSPFFKLDKVQAPVLIFHGTTDTNVPPAQSWSYFRALQYYGKVPVKFVVFPGEPHGPRKLTHQRRKVEEEMAWFDKYFFKTAKPENEAVKAGSPLDTALRSKSAARTGELYGATFTSKGKPVLIPEVVKRGDLEIGRFEVTRAQFSAFDKNYKVERDTENYPANGVTFEQARGYAVWLSKLTGQPWRIPKESEMSGKYHQKEGENTLDYWAGYAPNPDDVFRLREKLKELPGTAPLLKPVGSFSGEGQENEELLFDLGGNTAEWVLTADGKGKPAGGSADCPADTRSSCTPAPEYIGFRIVRGAATPPAAPAAARKE